MNKRVVVTQGLRIETFCKYIKFTESDTTKVVPKLSNSTLEIFFRKCRKSSDIVHRDITLLKAVPLVPTGYIELKDVYVKLNGFLFRRLTLQGFNLSIQIVEGPKEFLIYKNSSQLIVIVPANRTKDFKGFIKAINCSQMLEYVDACPEAYISNISSVFLIDGNFCYNSKDVSSRKAEDEYRKYLVSGVDVVYEYLNGLKQILENYGMGLQGYPIDEAAPARNFIRWKFTDKDKHVQRKSGDEPLNNCVQCKATIELEGNFQDLPIYEDFIFKYQNYELVSNYTSWYVPDLTGKRWLCSALYGAISTAFDSSQASNSDGNFAFSFSVTVDIFYYIVKNVASPQIWAQVTKILTSQCDPLTSEIITV